MKEVDTFSEALIEVLLATSASAYAEGYLESKYTELW